MRPDWCLKYLHRAGILTNRYEFGSVFSKDGKEFYLRSRYCGKGRNQVYAIERTMNGHAREASGESTNMDK
jgi:hypothetical protein